jgi:hypothetical protein
MKSRLAYFLIGLAVMMSTAELASAGKKSFSLDPFGFRRQSGTGVNLGSFGAAGVAIPAGSGGQVAMGFIVPRPYRTDTPMSISVYWHTVDPNCSIELLPDFVDRSRPGHLVTNGNPSGGLTPADASIVLVAGSVPNQGNVKIYSLGPEQGFDQRSGDSILLGFARGNGGNDTCPDDLIITGVNIEYLTP